MSSVKNANKKLFGKRPVVGGGGDGGGDGRNVPLSATKNRSVARANVPDDTKSESSLATTNYSHLIYSKLFPESKKGAKKVVVEPPASNLISTEFGSSVTTNDSGSTMEIGAKKGVVDYETKNDDGACR